MRSILFLFLYFGSISYSYAQEYSREFGNVFRDEWELTEYDKDPEAEAVVLFDIGSTYFIDVDGGYEIRFTRTKRIKILKDRGTEHAEIYIPYYVDGYGKTEIIRSLKAVTYNMENNVVVTHQLDPREVYQEEGSGSWRFKKFVFPKVRAGSIIEYRYELFTPFHFNLPDWTFQDRIPTVFSEYTVNLIPFYEYIFQAQGITKFDYRRSIPSPLKRTWGNVVKDHGQNIGTGVEFQDMINVFGMKDIPAFKDESFITSTDDYIMKMDFQLAKFHSPTGTTREVISTWPKLIEELLKEDEFGKYYKASAKVAKKILETELNITGKSDREKCEAVIRFVKSNVSWNGNLGKFTTTSPKKFWAQKKGNAAEINLFLGGMLEAAGISANPVILSTRGNGKITGNYPFIHFFNYVVMYITLGDVAFLADGTEKLLGFDQIPPRCINEKGLIVKKGQNKWAILEHKRPSVDQKIISLKVDPEALIAAAEVSIQATEYEAFRYRRTFQDTEKAWAKHLELEGITEIESFHTSHFKQSRQPYGILFKGEVTVEKAGEDLLINPFAKFPVQKNLLTQRTRTYPVDMTYPWTDVFETTLHIPAGYHVPHLPENFFSEDDLAVVSLDYRQKDETIVVKGKYGFKRTVYLPEQYPRIKTCFDDIVGKFNQKIVLVKK